MKVQVKIANNVFEIESSTEKELFGEMAHLYEVFGESMCGCCKSSSIHPLVRNPTFTDEKTKKEKTAQYYEMICNDCGARLSYGVHQTGETLFAKRKNDEGRFDVKHRGWKKFSRGSNGVARTGAPETAKEEIAF